LHVRSAAACQYRGENHPGHGHFTKRQRHPEADEPISKLGRWRAIGIRLSSMIDVGAGILGFLSAGIFLAHVLEGYRAE
jgi:hypothetical protein